MRIGPAAGGPGHRPREIPFILMPEPEFPNVRATLVSKGETGPSRLRKNRVFEGDIFDARGDDGRGDGSWCSLHVRHWRRLCVIFATLDGLIPLRPRFSECERDYRRSWSIRRTIPPSCGRDVGFCAFHRPAGMAGGARTSPFLGPTDRARCAPHNLSLVSV
jgi:hypothetical protein